MTPSENLCKPMWCFWVLFSVIDWAMNGSASKTPSEHHVDIGKAYLAKGAFQEALEEFHRALDADPENYMTYYRRATVYLALGKAKAALVDLDKVIELKPDFLAARLQRGSVYLKQGRLREAQEDFMAILTIDAAHDEAKAYMSNIHPLQAKIEDAQMAYEDEEFPLAIDILSDVLENHCSWSAELRQLRGRSYMAMGDMPQAISDLKSTVHMTPDNTEGHYELSDIYYSVGEVHEGLNAIRECLKLDQDNKKCFKLYKRLKKLAKIIDQLESSRKEDNWDTCVKSGLSLLAEEKEVLPVRFRALDKLCQCYPKIGQSSQGIEMCTAALSIEEHPRVFCDRADAHLDEENFEDAIADFQTALNIDQGFSRAKEGLQRAQRLQKQLSKRDYYKILGVNRKATKKEITKAYRKLAQKWHPDNFTDEKDKKAAEKKFMDIAAAKEVLSDPEKRKKFDHGEDPLDPEAQANRGFNPFHQHFRHGGQTFTFHFT